MNKTDTAWMLSDRGAEISSGDLWKVYAVKVYEVGVDVNTFDVVCTGSYWRRRAPDALVQTAHLSPDHFAASTAQGISSVSEADAKRLAMEAAHDYWRTHSGIMEENKS